MIRSSSRAAETGMRGYGMYRQVVPRKPLFLRTQLTIQSIDWCLPQKAGALRGARVQLRVGAGRPDIYHGLAGAARTRAVERGWGQGVRMDQHPPSGGPGRVVRRALARRYGRPAPVAGVQPNDT